MGEYREASIQKVHKGIKEVDKGMILGVGKANPKRKGVKKMENETRKQGKNVVREIDAGDHILQRRRVDRKGMKEPLEYDLKIPKSEEAWSLIYGKGDLLNKGIASLKTENDDAIETSGQSISEEKKFKTAIKSASDEQRKKIAEILGLSISEAAIKMEELKKEYKKHGIGK